MAKSKNLPKKMKKMKSPSKKAPIPKKQNKKY